MTHGKTMYFSPAEFTIMLELAGENPCSFLRGGDMPDDEELTLAFSSLYRRGLILRMGDGFAVSGPGQMFARMRGAPWAVFISGKQPYAGEAVCYVEEDILWLVELADFVFSRQYRVQLLGKMELKKWFFDTGLLDCPALTDDDTAELSKLFAEELTETSGRLLLRLEKYANGGPLLITYEVRKGKSGCLICDCGEVGQGVAIYTEEALSRMLTDCFGKGDYDYC